MHIKTNNTETHLGTKVLLLTEDMVSSSFKPANSECLVPLCGELVVFCSNLGLFSFRGAVFTRYIGDWMAAFCASGLVGFVSCFERNNETLV